MAIEIQTLVQVNGLPFGASLQDVEDLLGHADQALENYTGELELLYGDAFYRFFADRFVEATFPDTDRFKVDGLQILSMYEWLQGCRDVVDLAKFRISLSHGIAYDNRMPGNGSVTVFEQGRWDRLVLDSGNA